MKEDERGEFYFAATETYVWASLTYLLLLNLTWVILLPRQYKFNYLWSRSTILGLFECGMAGLTFHAPNRLNLTERRLLA